MSKKNSMQKEVEKDEMLIDVGPENGQAIVDAARIYKKHQNDRIIAGKKEVQQREKVKKLVKEANLTPLKDGTIKFTYGKVTICVTPRDELITIKEEKPKKKRRAKNERYSPPEGDSRHAEEWRQTHT